MVRTQIRLGLLLIAQCVLFAIANAQPQFEVTSPANGVFVSGTATVQFNITRLTGANNRRVLVRGEARRAGRLIASSEEAEFNPDAEGRVNNGSVSIPFQTNLNGAQDGAIVITVRARFQGVTTPFATATRNVTLDTVRPKVLDFSPLDGQFLKRGPRYFIRATLEERNLKEWRVQVNSANIPSNTGTNLSILVPWETREIQFDGQATILITATDEANQSNDSRSLNVTLDSISPVATVVFPTTDKTLNRNSNINVTVDVTDASQQSTDRTGIDVVITDLNNRFVYRVPRSGFTGGTGNANRWTGRIRREVSNRIPSRFILRVQARDKAGNVGVLQTVRLRIQ
jgi:hypothetical protein